MKMLLLLKAFKNDSLSLFFHEENPTFTIIDSSSYS